MAKKKNNRNKIKASTKRRYKKKVTKNKVKIK